MRFDLLTDDQLRAIAGTSLGYSTVSMALELLEYRRSYGPLGTEWLDNPYVVGTIMETKTPVSILRRVADEPTGPARTTTVQTESKVDIHIHGNADVVVFSDNDDNTQDEGEDKGESPDKPTDKA